MRETASRKGITKMFEELGVKVAGKYCGTRWAGSRRLKEVILKRYESDALEDLVAWWMAKDDLRAAGLTEDEIEEMENEVIDEIKEETKAA